MRFWTEHELEQIGRSTELELASRRADGTGRPPTTMWVVRVGDSIYVRSAGGPNRSWYVRARESGFGRACANGVDADVRIVPAPDAPHAEIDAAYHEKYDRYGPRIVGHVVGEGAATVTLRIAPES